MSNQVNGFFPGRLHPSQTLGGCIDIFEGVWPNPQDTIDKIENITNTPDSDVYWRKAEIINMGADQNYRSNRVCDITHLSRITNNGVLQNVHNQFYMLLLAASVPYSEKYQIHEPFFHEDYCMLKYRPGEQYKCHYDSSTSVGRAVSALVYLNDDYEGGELEFPNFDVKLKLSPGSLVLFPSNFAYSHISHPIQTGTKYALVTWLRDRDY